jgi:hypothetical protein
MYCP